MLKKEAQKIVGGLSKPGKMPGPAYNLPAWNCITGAKLRKVKTSPCYGCYALKLRYTWPIVRQAMDRRLQAIESPKWVSAMVVLVTGHPFFRWHDSGDIQSAEHLQKIFEVCRQTPNTKHWLPTQERQFLTMDPDEVPDNLIIRLSGSKVDGPASKCWPHSSSVVTDDTTRTCPAPEQGNKCRSCRACWDKNIGNIAYGKHQKKKNKARRLAAVVPGRPRTTAAMVPRRLREVFQVVKRGTQEEALRDQNRLL